MRRPLEALVSVRGRITAVVTVSFALLMTFGSWFLLDRAEAAWIDDLEAQDLAELEMMAADLVAISMVDPMFDPGWLLPVGEGGTTFTLSDETGGVVAATPNEVVWAGPVSAHDLTIAEFTPSPYVAVDVIPVGDFTNVSVPVELASGTLTLTAASSLEPVRAGVDTLRNMLVLLVPLLAGGIGATSWFVTGRAFRPVESITDQVGLITDDRLDERVPVPSSRDEVARLAVTMNTMLERLASSSRRQKQFVSDASHELRNPIAASRAKLEVALAHPESGDWEKTAVAVLEEQERLEELVDSLLQLARLDESGRGAAEGVDIDDVLFAEMARIGHSPIEVGEVEPTQVVGNRTQLTHAIRNLLENAIRHAEARIVVSLRREQDDAVLAVDDDGPGVPDGSRSVVFDRFVRLDESRHRERGGAGLGLAVVAAVAKAHNGSACVADSPLGGARFELRLPAGEPLT